MPIDTADPSFAATIFLSFFFSRYSEKFLRILSGTPEKKLTLFFFKTLKRF